MFSSVDQVGPHRDGHLPSDGGDFHSFGYPHIDGRTVALHQRHGAAARFEHAGKEVVVADELGDEFGAGTLVDFPGGADLLDHRVAHHDHLVRQGHGLLLGVGDQDEGHLQIALDFLQLHHHRLAQAVVQRSQWFVQQQHGRLADQGAGQGHTLLLPAAQLMGTAVGIFGHVHLFDHLGHPARPLGRGHALHFQAELHILGHRAVGEQGEALEHHGGVALGGRHFGHVFSGDVDFSRGDFLQAADHAQGGGLAAAAGPQHGHQFAMLDLHAEIDHGAGAPGKHLVHFFKHNVELRHDCL